MFDKNGPILLETQDVQFSQKLTIEKDLLKAAGRVRYKKCPRGEWAISDDGVLTVKLNLETPIKLNEVEGLFKQMRK